MSEASKIGGTPHDYPQQIAWLVAAHHVVQLVFPSGDNPYLSETQWYVDDSKRSENPLAHIAVMVALLRRLQEEIEGGLLTRIENHAIAATFDDFLDHGAEYLKHGRKNEAGVIAGIVFEDTVRRICRVRGVSEKGVALDSLIAELVKLDALSQVKAKRARAAGGVRTSAAHARWEEFEAKDVGPVIELTRELIETQLG
jgi:hypothetical protein